MPPRHWICPTRDYNRRDVLCKPGGSSCSNLRLLQADPEGAPFYDEALMRATEEINTILQGLQPPDGRGLALINLGFGSLLVWAKVDEILGPEPEGALAFESAEEDIRASLGIRG
jgi:hypothetical protein